MNTEKHIRYEVEGIIYITTSETEQAYFRKMKANHSPDSIVIVYDSDGSELDRLPLDALI